MITISPETLEDPTVISSRSIQTSRSKRKAGPRAQRHLFIVGFFRTGTSLLYSFLNLHPDIKLVFESDLLGNSLVTTSTRTDQKWWERLDFYNSSISRHGLSPLPAWNQATHMREQAEILYRQYGGAEPLYIGEKCPSYYNRLRLLARSYPHARFLVIWRNPKDVISSILKAGESHYFFRSRSLPLRSLLGLEQMQSDVLALRRRGSAVHDLCYEDLVRNPEEVLTAACAFLDLPFDPRMLDLAEADCSMFPLGEHHSKVRSGTVCATLHAPLPAVQRLQPKINRYLARWRSQFQENLATRRYWNEATATPPGPFELAKDRLTYEFKRFVCEQLVPFIYGFTPYAWLQTYRRLRNSSATKRPVAPAVLQEKTALRPLKFSIVTPSYRQLPWLKLCAASIADQENVHVEHIVQDAQSGSELASWIQENTKARLYVEPDSGMYDAINRGFARATGDIVSWLNCDEQYTEGALTRVADYFDAHPDVDVLFGDALLVGNTGKLLSYRRTILPNRHHIRLAHLNVLSCATFVRRSVLERGYKMDERWKAIADAVWVVDMLDGGVTMAVLNEPLAIFTITDKNLGQTSLAFAETRAWQKETSANKSWLRPLVVMWHRVEKLIHGAYLPRSVAARFFTLASTHQRITQTAPSLGFQWPQSSGS